MTMTSTLPDYPALVLNADFTPMRIFPLSLWDFARTFRNVMKDRVVVVDEYDAVFRSRDLKYHPPSVVALRDYVRVPDHVPFNRMNILVRDSFQCQYCGVPLDLGNMTFDHVVPRSRGGKSGFENIVSACMPCNSLKGDRSDMKPRTAPHVPTARELLRKRPLDTSRLNSSWISALYWSSTLEQG